MRKKNRKISTFLFFNKPQAINENAIDSTGSPISKEIFFPTKKEEMRISFYFQWDQRLHVDAAEKLIKARLLARFTILLSRFRDYLRK